MMSPGSSGKTPDNSAINRGTLNTRSFVRAFCTHWPSTEHPRQVVAVRKLVGGDDPWSHRPVPAARLAERELLAGRELEVAIADVLAHGEACDERPGVVFGHTIRALAHDDHQFDLPVDAVV